ncbi:MAG: polyphenol oxidase family protein [Gemmatimonadales bacterium]
MTELPVQGPVPRFELAPWGELGIVAGITGRGGGEPPFDLGLGGSSTPVGRVMDNWRRFQASLTGFAGVVVSRQVHGTQIRWHEQINGFLIQYRADGHGTGTAGVLLAVTVADCIPIYLADPSHRVAVLVHAGWRGVAGGILGRALELLELKGSRAEDLLVHCGVGICGACYEVGPEVFTRCGITVPPTGKGPLDLRACLAEQARAKGAGKVSTSPFCSRHDSTLFFSHRGSGGRDGRMVAYLGFLR